MPPIWNKHCEWLINVNICNEWMNEWIWMNFICLKCKVSIFTNSQRYCKNVSRKKDLCIIKHAVYYLFEWKEYVTQTINK